MDFGDFYEATSRRTLRYAYGLTGDLHQAQDVTQEAYTRAWQRWRQLSGYDDAEAWLRVVVNRLVQDWWRHLGVRRRIRLEPAAPLPAPSEDSVLLTTALKQLPPAQRQALALHYLLDLSVAQIAAETGVSEGTVKSWLSRGRAGLADSLREEADAAGLPGAGAVADAGRRRRRTRTITTVTAAGLAVIVVVGLAVAVIRGARHDQPVRPSPSATLRGLGTVIDQRGTVDSGAVLADGRIYVARTGKDSVLTVYALDAATGDPVWTQVVPGGHGSVGGMTVMPGYLRIFDSMPDPARAWMSILDRETGRVLWQRDVTAEVYGDEPEPTSLATPEGVALVDGVSGISTFLDARTGLVRWTRPTGRGTPIVEWRPSVEGPAVHGIRWFDESTSREVFSVLAANGTLTEFRTATGEPTGRRWTGIRPPAGADELAYAGQLYFFTDTRLTTYDLGGTGPVVSYTANPVSPGTRVTHRINEVTPCGHDAMCLLDGNPTDEERGVNPYELVMIHSDGRIARMPLTQDGWLTTAGEYVLLTDGVYDAELRPVLPESLPPVETLALEGTSVLLAGMPPSSEIGTPHEIYRFDLASRKLTDLGAVGNAQVLLVAGGRLLLGTNEGYELYAY